MYMTQTHKYVHMNICICILSPLLWTELEKFEGDAEKQNQKSRVWLETIFCPLNSGKNIRIVGGEYRQISAIVSGNTFLSGILNSCYCLQLEGYIEGNCLF